MSLINPTLENIDLYLDDLMDKNGSDYHSLPVKLDRFIQCTYRMISSNLIYFESTQTISDDIRPLIIERSDISILRGEQVGVWKVPEPTDYYRLIQVYPLSEGVRFAREVKILKNGQEDYEQNPFREPNRESILVYRLSDFFQIKTGKDDFIQYDAAYLKYCKHPTFATEKELEKRIVNLPLEAIIRICDDTANSFRYTTGDSSAPAVEQFTSKFGKRNRS